MAHHNHIVFTDFTINGTEGNDRIDYLDHPDSRVFASIGEPGATIYGHGGHDDIEGWGGDDRLYGGAGDDKLSSYGGNDELYGGPGDDYLSRGPFRGDKLFDGGPGADYMSGGNADFSYESGVDTFIFRPGDSTAGGGDVIVDFDPGDRIILSGWSNHELTSTGLIKVSGTAGPSWYFLHTYNSLYARIITLPDGGKITLLNVKDVEFDEIVIIGAQGRQGEEDGFIIREVKGDQQTGGADDGDPPATGGGDTGGARPPPRNLTGGQGPDRLNGGEGDDRLTGVGGNDDLRGYGGDDALNGGPGDDRLAGMAGNDDLEGGSGDDTMYGGSGDDTMDGNSGDDKLYGGAGADDLYGGGGENRLSGGSGNDRLYGDWADDTMYGGTGADELYGGAADDKLYGGPGDDKLYGQAGDDLISGGPGEDRLSGGPGDDTFRFAPGHSSGEGDVITDFDYPAGDRIMLTGFSSGNPRLSNVLDADADGDRDDRIITLPDGGEIALLDVGFDNIII